MTNNTRTSMAIRVAICMLVIACGGPIEEEDGNEGPIDEISFAGESQALETNSCGGWSQPCCTNLSGKYCFMNGYDWLYCSNVSLCEPCGMPGEKCCPTSVPNLICSDIDGSNGYCDVATNTCKTPKGSGCGEAGQKCCRGDYAHAWAPFCKGTNLCLTGQICHKPVAVYKKSRCINYNERHYYSFPVRPGTEFRAVMTAPTRNPDLYVRFGQAPTLSSFNCAPRKAAGMTESCVLQVPAGVTSAHVMVYGRAPATSCYGLTVKYYPAD